MQPVSHVTNAVNLSKLALIITLTSGLGIVLFIGLMSGLVGRPNNCIPVIPTFPDLKTSTLQPLSTLAGSSSTPTTLQPGSNRTIPSFTTASTNPSGQLTTPQQTNIRLPDIFIPSNYNLDLKVFFEPNGDSSSSAEKFEGRVIIDFKLTRSTKRILLHADTSLVINDPIEITSLSNLQITKVREDKHSHSENQLYEILLDDELPAGEYKIKLDYVGNFGPASNIIGFYKTKYQEDGITKNLVATKFQPTDARKAYPCFDEPALKATFEITIEHPMGTKALSNWPEQPRQVVSGNRYRTSFDKTFPMSTYLAAWTVLPDDFAHLEIMSARNKLIRVFARKDAVKNGLIDYALEITKKSIDFFETEYFDIELNAVPPKIDMIGFPDFPSGAMEHWGLVGYRETNLLYSDEKNSLSNKQSVAFVIAHEISHFWFGNLVTCKWWNDLWLNEAMARFLQFKAIQSINPGWDVENQFLTLYQIPVMFDDGLQTSTPVSAEVLTPAQINSAFGSITYDKGSSLLRMLESTVGAKNFQDGLKNYLKKNEFKASVAADFYNSLTLPPEMSGVTPQEYMENWLLQINYPEVSVIMKVNSGISRVEFVQDRFLLSQEGFGGADTVSPFGYKWMIYLQCKAGGTFKSQTGQPDHLNGDIKDFNYFLKDTDGFIDLDRRYTWVKCNKDFKSYYVTDYLNSNFEALETVLLNKPNVFTVGDRANLIHVAYSLAYLGSKSYATPALLTNYLETWEKDYVPWRTFTWHMTKIASLLEHRPGFANLKDFGTSIVRSLLNYSGFNLWDNQGSHSERLLKINLIEFLCRMQDDTCLTNSTTFFKKINPDYFNDPTNVINDLPPNYRGVVYKYHLQNTYEYLDWFQVNNVYVSTIDPQERSIVLSAITQSRLTWILDLLLDELLKPDSAIRPQDFFTVLVAISRNPSGRHLAWYFVRHYWYEIIGKFGLSSRTLANSIKSICETFENEFMLEEMIIFFLTTNPGAGSLQRSQALDAVVHNIFWINDREPDINTNLFVPFKTMKKTNSLNIFKI